MLFLPLQLAASMLLAATETVGTTGVVDVYQTDARRYTLVQDERSYFWLTDVTEREAAEFIGPVKGLKEKADITSAWDPVAGCWQVQTDELTHLRSGIERTFSFDALRENRRQVLTGKAFHWLTGDEVADRTHLSPLQLATFLEDMEGDAAIAISSSASSGRLVGAIYVLAAPLLTRHENDDLMNEGHIQIWERVGEANSQRRLPRETPVQPPETDASSEDAPLPAPQARTTLSQLSGMKALDPAWVLLADERRTLTPPLLLLVTDDEIMLLDDAGAAWLVQNGSLMSAGSFPGWKTFDDRMLVRDASSFSFYGRRGGNWQSLSFSGVGAISSILRGAKPLDDALRADLDAIMRNRESLRREIDALEVQSWRTLP
jgi:hypothetical protein